MIKLLNTDCLGNALTKNKASTYNAKFINNNCCNFNGTSDYIYIPLSTGTFDADKIAVCFETTSASYSTLITNVFPKASGEKGNKIELRDSTTIRLYYNDSCFDYTVPTYTDGKPHELIVSSDKTLMLDGVNYNGNEKSESYTFNGIYIGVRYASDFNYYFKGKLWNLRIYKKTTLTYHYPMAEGAATYIYNALDDGDGMTHGSITTASISNFWSETQDEYAYNTLEGFKLLNNGARIPLTVSITGVEYPSVANGKNYSEASLTFIDLLYASSNTTVPLVSVKYMDPYVNPDPSMGASTGSGWNITSQQSTTLAKNNWFANTRVLYLKNTENALPDGVTVGLDIKTQNHVGYSPGNYFFYHNASDNPFTHNGNTIPAFFKLKFSFWYKKNEGVTEGNLSIGSQYLTLLQLINTKLDTEWHFIEKEVLVDLTKAMAYRAYYTDTQKSVAISWCMGTNDTATYAGTIADFNYTMSQTYQTLSPVYCKVDSDTKSISNILMYDKYQEGLELTRIENHLKRF